MTVSPRSSGGKGSATRPLNQPPRRGTPHLGRADRPADRVPTRRELLDEIAYLAYLVDARAGDLNRLGGEVASVLGDRGAS